MCLQIAEVTASHEPRRTFVTNGFVGGVVADLDADGKADLVVVAGSRALAFLDQGP